MTPKEIDVTIRPDGEVEIHVQGFKGKACLEVAKAFEKVVGELISQKETHEFYEPDTPVHQTLEQRYGQSSEDSYS